MARKPLFLVPYCKTAIWGGERLKRDYGKVTSVAPLAETWEVSVREKENAVVTGGEYDGLTLGEAIREMGYASVSPTYDGTRFPLLIKFIDAASPLSVQVHPDDAYAAHFGDNGKTEMWVIVSAAPGATLLYGLRDGMTASDLRRAVDDGETLRVLREVPVKAGDVFYIPAGMPHAIGEGIVLCEVQQNCDLTYRLYDYDRLGADGKPRELHIEKALAVVRGFTDAEVAAEQYRFAPASPTLLADAPYFRTERFDTASGDVTLQIGDTFRAVICTDGSGTLVSDGEIYPMKAGSSCFIPAGCAPCTLRGDAVYVTATAR